MSGNVDLSRLVRWSAQLAISVVCTVFVDAYTGHVLPYTTFCEERRQLQVSVSLFTFFEWRVCCGWFESSTGSVNVVQIWRLRMKGFFRGAVFAFLITVVLWVASGYFVVQVFL